MHIGGVLLVMLSAALQAGQAPPAAIVKPFEISDKGFSENEIDRLVGASLAKHSIERAALCSDAVFLRRVYVDVTGTLPDAPVVRNFLSIKTPNKRAELIDALLESEAFADYQTMKWCDLLRVKAEFPINLWPNAVQAYHRWIHDAVARNMPYDQFVRELLTSSGSNFRVPQVNFYRAVQERSPSSIASAAALTFMGIHLEKLTPQQQRELEALFSRVAYKETAEWKEEIVFLNPAKSEPFETVFPDGKTVTIQSGEDPRLVFADWLTTPENPWFSRNIVNRVWALLMGRGIIHEPDDLREDNLPANPELLAFLEKELIKADFDLKHIYRLILNSRTYQQSSISRTDHPKAETLFAYYPVRRLEAEVLIDAICRITGTHESYSSLIPEPFTFIPEEHRSVELTDGSITSQFLEMFGRPSRDTGLDSERNNQPTDSQRLHLLNSSHIQRKIENSPRFRELVRSRGRNPRLLVETIYLTVLSRFPMDEELTIAQAYLKTEGLSLNQSASDLIWALINTKEFLYRH